MDQLGKQKVEILLEKVGAHLTVARRRKHVFSFYLFSYTHTSRRVYLSPFLSLRCGKEASSYSAVTAA